MSARHPNPSVWRVARGYPVTLVVVALATMYFLALYLYGCLSG